MGYQYPIITDILTDKYNAHQQKELCPFADTTKNTIHEWFVSAIPGSPEKILSSAHNICSLLTQPTESIRLNSNYSFSFTMPELLLSFDMLSESISLLNKNLGDRVSELFSLCREEELEPSLISLWSLYSFVKNSRVIDLDKWGIVVSFKGEFCLNIDKGKNKIISLRFDDNGEVEFLIFTPKLSGKDRYIYTGTTCLTRLNDIINTSEIAKFI